MLSLIRLNTQGLLLCSFEIIQNVIYLNVSFQKGVSELIARGTQSTQESLDNLIDQGELLPVRASFLGKGFSGSEEEELEERAQMDIEV